MALEEPEVSSENRGPGFVAIRRKIIFTQDEPEFLWVWVCEGSLLCVSGCLKQMHSHSCYKYSSRMDACKDSVALNEWSHFPHYSIVTSECCRKGRRRHRQISLRQLSSCLLWVIINVTSDRHLSPVSTGLNVWIRQSNQWHKRPHFFYIKLYCPGRQDLLSCPAVSLFKCADQCVLQFLIAKKDVFKDWPLLSEMQSGLL